jgi:hypothetical protein
MFEDYPGAQLSKTSHSAELCPGDRVLYYSPSEVIGQWTMAEAFTAVGEICGTPAGTGGGPHLSVRLRLGCETPLWQFLSLLSFMRSHDWRQRVAEQGLIRILPEDYRIASDALQVLETW